MIKFLQKKSVLATRKCDSVVAVNRVGKSLGSYFTLIAPLDIQALWRGDQLTGPKLSHFLVSRTALGKDGWAEVFMSSKCIYATPLFQLRKWKAMAKQRLTVS